MAIDLPSKLMILMTIHLKLYLIQGYSAINPTQPYSPCPKPCACQKVLIPNQSRDRVVVDCSSRNLAALPDFSILNDENLILDIYLSGNRFSHILGTSFWFIGDRTRLIHLKNNQKPFRVANRAFSQPHYHIKVLQLGPTDLDLQRDLMSLCENKHLEELYVDAMTSSPASLDELTDGGDGSRLKVLRINNAKLTSIGHMAVAGLRLVELGLSNNLISKFPTQLWFLMSDSLRELHLDGNQIPYLQRNHFPTECKLTVINLQNNNLIVIEQGSLDSCSDLKHLNLEGNKNLVYLDPTVFSSFRDITIDLRETSVKRFDFIRPSQVKEMVAFSSHETCDCDATRDSLVLFKSKLKGQCKDPSTYALVSILHVCLGVNHDDVTREDLLQKNKGTLERIQDGVFDMFINGFFGGEVTDEAKKVKNEVNDELKDEVKEQMTGSISSSTIWNQKYILDTKHVKTHIKYVGASTENKDSGQYIVKNISPVEHRERHAYSNSHTPTIKTPLFVKEEKTDADKANTVEHETTVPERTQTIHKHEESVHIKGRSNSDITRHTNVAKPKEDTEITFAHVDEPESVRINDNLRQIINYQKCHRSCKKRCSKHPTTLITNSSNYSNSSYLSNVTLKHNDNASDFIHRGLVDVVGESVVIKRLVGERTLLELEIKKLRKNLFAVRMSNQQVFRISSNGESKYRKTNFSLRRKRRRPDSETDQERHSDVVAKKQLVVISKNTSIEPYESDEILEQKIEVVGNYYQPGSKQLGQVKKHTKEPFREQNEKHNITVGCKSLIEDTVFRQSRDGNRQSKQSRVHPKYLLFASLFNICITCAVSSHLNRRNTEWGLGVVLLAEKGVDLMYNQRKTKSSKYGRYSELDSEHSIGDGKDQVDLKGGGSHGPGGRPLLLERRNPMRRMKSISSSSKSTESKSQANWIR